MFHIFTGETELNYQEYPALPVVVKSAFLHDVPEDIWHIADHHTDISEVTLGIGDFFYKYCPGGPEHLFQINERRQEALRKLKIQIMSKGIDIASLETKDSTNYECLRVKY